MTFRYVHFALLAIPLSAFSQLSGTVPTSTTDGGGPQLGFPALFDVGVAGTTPASGDLLICEGATLTVSATLHNYGFFPASGFNVRYSFDGGALVSEAYSGSLSYNQSAVFTFTQPIAITTGGTHTLTVSTDFSWDSNGANNSLASTITAVQSVAVPAPFLEDVESGAVVPAGWTLQNPDNSTTWTTTVVANGPECSSTRAWTINYYGYSSTGQEDRLLTPRIDLSPSASNHLTFDHAYARYSSSYSDGFRVDISTDCGSSWTTLYTAAGAALATAPNNTGSNWQPANCSQWAAHDIDLSAYDGEMAIFRFTGTCGYGQRLYFDNVSVSGTPVAAIYYSRASGGTSDPIWSPTPNGTAATALLDGAKSIVIQPGDTVINTLMTTVNKLVVQNGGTLTLSPFVTLTVSGDTARIDGALSMADNSTLVLAGAGPVQLTGSGPLNVCNLVVNTPAGAKLGTDLAICGTLQLNDGSFDATAATVTLQSTETSTGRIGPVAASADFLGAITMQRRIPAGVTNWRYLGSPVGGTVQGWDDDFITAGFPGSDYPTFDSPVGSGILWPSIRWYDETVPDADPESGLVGASGTTQALVPGQGFAVWCGNSLGGTAAFTIDVTGAPNIAHAPMALPLTWTDSGHPADDGWNLVSNPLPSPIRFSDIALGADVAHYITFYDPASGNTAVYDKTSGIGTNGGSDLIQSSQGFWLKANGPAVTTTVSEAAKVDDNSGGFFGGDLSSTASLLRLRVNSAVNSFHDETVVYFDGGVPGADPLDVPKHVFAYAGAPQVATLGGDSLSLAINACGPLTSALSIPVTVNASISGLYTLTVDGMENIGLACLSLEDLQTGAVIPLMNGVSYAFSTTATEDHSIPRFLLHATAPLPLQLMDATCSGETDGQAEVDSIPGPADVNWTLASGSIVLEQAGVSGTATVTGLAPGNYSVHVMTASACGELVHDFSIQAPSALEAGTVDITPDPCADSIAGSIAVGMLGGVPPYSYLWSDGSADSILVGTAGPYSATVTDAHGCTWTSDTLEIPALPGVHADFSFPQGVIMADDPVPFTNTGGFAESWSWDFGDGTGSEAFEPVHAWEGSGNYSVQLTASAHGCTDTRTQEVMVETVTGLGGNPASAGMRVWSTPQAFIVQMPLGRSAARVDVFDALGRQAVARVATGDAHRLEVSNLALSEGIWFVRVTADGEQRSFRVPLVR